MSGISQTGVQHDRFEPLCHFDIVEYVFTVIYKSSPIIPFGESRAIRKNTV